MSGCVDALLKYLTFSLMQAEYGLRQHSSRAQRTFRPFCDCRRGAASSQLQANRQSQRAALLAEARPGRRPALLRCCCSRESSSNGSSDAEEQSAGWPLRGRGAALRQAAAAAAIGAALLAGATHAHAVLNIGSYLRSRQA